MSEEVNEHGDVRDRLLNVFYHDIFIPNCANDSTYHRIVEAFGNSDGNEHCYDELQTLNLYHHNMFEFIRELNDVVLQQLIYDYGSFEEPTDQDFDLLSKEFNSSGERHFLTCMAYFAFRFAFGKHYVKHIVLHDLEMERKRKNEHIV